MKPIGNGTKMLISESDDLLITLAHGEPVCPDGEYPYELGANVAYCYACDIIQGRWPEAEPTIMASPKWAYWYAYDLIKGCWPEAEPSIMISAEWACHYAKYVIKARWPEAEPVIKTDEDYWKWYKNAYH